MYDVVDLHFMNSAWASSIIYSTCTFNPFVRNFESTFYAVSSNDVPLPFLWIDMTVASFQSFGSDWTFIWSFIILKDFIDIITSSNVGTGTNKYTVWQLNCFNHRLLSLSVSFPLDNIVIYYIKMFEIRLQVWIRAKIL